MLSLEQLSQAVKEHLGLYNSEDRAQPTYKWTIGESSLGGRGLIATEDIKAGEVLFVDHPLIYGPRAGSNLPKGCSVCCILDCETFFKCSKCALLLCSEQCQSTTTHLEDCGAISRWNNKIPIEEVDDTLMSRALTAIRALLLNEDQKQFMGYLQANAQPQHGREIRDIKPFFDIQEDEELLMILACCALDTNAFQIATPYGKNEASMRGLYPVSGLMNHTCVPNTRYSYNDQRQMSVSAVKPIRAGREIFSCYTGTLWGTPARRTHLYKTKHFICKCDRCADPTERGTLLAALKCFSAECPGVLLPVEPLKMTSAWRCIECDLRVPYGNICSIQGALGSLMGSLNFENVGELESFLVNRITKHIPRTNQIVVDLHCRLIWMLGDSEGLRWHPPAGRSDANYVRLDTPASSLKTDENYTASSYFDIGTWISNNSLVCRRSLLGLRLSPSVKMELHPYELLEQLLDLNSGQRNWTILKSDTGGRGLFTTKTIKKGTLIFESSPLVIGPRPDCARKPFCTVCCRSGVSYKTCDKCSVLLCSKECEMTLTHNKLCDFMKNNWTVKPNCEHYTESLGCALIYLKCLLLEDKSLLNILQANQTSLYIEDIDDLCSKYDIPIEQKQFMETVYSVLKTNAFRIAHNPEEKQITLRGLYPLSSFMNHCCVPNTRNIFKNDYTMSVYAAKDIEKGEEILTCYTAFLWSSPARRCQLYKTKGFWCKCLRCRDRTEMGTNLSALKCFDKNCIGVLLPREPTDPGTDWSCDNCGTEVAADRICIVQSALGSLVGTMDLDDQFRLETFVLERLANFVPYSSHIFVDLRLRLALRIGTKGSKLKELSESRVSLKESLCRGTLRTLAALGAGDAHLRGLLLYHLHAALAERARRSPALYDELKSEIESSIEQAYHILQGDISAPPDLELRRRYLGPGCDKPQEERFFILDS